MTDTFMDRALEWDDEIENESEFVLLPEGEYDFEVVKFERGQHSGSKKLPPCKKAILSIRVSNGKDSTLITHNLFLHTKVEGMLSAFFIAIGEKKHGEKVRMNWNNVTGAKGRCKVYVDKFTRKDGTTGESNKIKSFLEPKPAEDKPQNTYGGF